MGEKIRIHLTDDHQIIIDGLLAVLKLEDDFEVVGFSLNGHNLYERLTSNKADILIMDINMPDIDGIDILKSFQAKGLPCKTIILSSYDDLKVIKEVLKLGVSGYLSKKCAGENITDAIRAVYRGEQYFSDTIKNKIVNSFSGIENNGSTDGETAPIPYNITKRELEILQLISQEFSTKDISKELALSPNTVDTHRKKLMRKLQVKNSIGLVKFAIKNNLV
ncbi:response regulator [Pseudofulvibacter geojedonensis]|uniref:Response regulator n=1 Tax=Pseudofulvibacter geojedonensis TaxID=1123758 RepID=A0ABW3HZK2_9FLAO